MLFRVNLGYGQIGISLALPFGKMYGESIDNTKYITGFNANFLYYVFLNESGKSLLLTEAGFGLPVGTKQVNVSGVTYKARLSSVHLGINYCYKFKEPDNTFYLLAGVNLHALMKDEPELLINNGNSTQVENLYHKVLFPEAVVGAGYALGKFCLEIRENFGLTSLSKDYSIQSNVISVHLIFTNVNKNFYR
jgi:hypothetical protein